MKKVISEPENHLKWYTLRYFDTHIAYTAIHKKL